MSTPYTIQVGQRLTDFSSVDVTVARVAHGGMGLVAFGPDRFNEGNWSALKTVRPDALAHSPDMSERFIREGLTWCGLWLHPNILTAQFVTQIDGRPFLVLDYTEHGSLADVLTRGPFTLANALRVAQHIAAGLIALHIPDPGRLRPDPIVHRDLKPDNVLIFQGGNSQYAQITDFGLVALLPQIAGMPPSDEDTPIDATRSARFHTRQGSVLGTVAYMAPEQWVDLALVGSPVDLYAMGLILGQCLTGAHPLLPLTQRHSVQAWRAAHERGMPQQLPAVVPETPVPLEILYQSLLAKRATDRPTAAEALAALNAVTQRLGLPSYTPPEIYAHTPEHEIIRWQSWANAYARFNLFEEALARNDRALVLAPQHPSVLLNRGTIFLKMQRWAEAQVCYQASLQALPREEHIGRNIVYQQFGVLYNEQGQYGAAEEAYAQALTEMPDAALTWRNRGLNQHQWGVAEAAARRRNDAVRHLRLALDEYAHALRLVPHNTDLPRDLAIAQHDLADLGA